MNNMIEENDENANTTNFISSLNIPSKLKKLFKLSKFPLIATLSFDPTITAGIGMLYVAGEGIISQIEMQNMEVFLQEYIDRKFDDYIEIEDKAKRELMIHAILKSLRCSKEAQIKRIVDVVQETLENEEIQIDEAEDFINVISELSEREAILLARCYKYFSDNPSSPKFTIKNEDIFGNISKNNWDYLLSRLEGKGLLNSEPTAASMDDIDEIFSDNRNDFDEQEIIMNMKTYFRTEFGSRLFQSLREREL